MEKFDLVVIGAGPSGYAAAMRSIDFKKKTLLIEKKSVGGAGVTNGALSSKTWWELSRQVRQANANHIIASELEFTDFAKMVNEAVLSKRKLLEDQINFLSTQSENYLSFIQGQAKLLTKNEVEIKLEDGSTKIVYTDHIVLATGSRPRKLPHIPIDDKIILTSDSIESLDSFPESMVIVGAGVIGCEYATIFSGFGKTQVNIIDKGSHILPFEDQDVVSVIEGNMERTGVNIHRNSKLIRMDIVDGKVEYELEYTDGKKQIYHVEKALVSVGRVPNFENLWEEAIPIKLDDRGIDDQETRTSVGNVYAVGDLTADIALVNVGELEGRYAVERIFGQPKRKLVYENISTIMFLNPEVAGVGLNETQARNNKINYKVVTLDYSCISRAIAERNTQGFIKLLVTDDDEMKILGMRVVGNHSSSAIQAVALLISMKKGIDELAECVHPHPSITEGIQECVRMLMGKSLFKPSALEGKLTCRRSVNKDYSDIVF